MISYDWKAPSTENVKRIVEGDLATCTSEQAAAFNAYCVEPCLAPIVRYGNLEKVVVVARKENQVIYWEDVEEGFGVSAVGAEGNILDHDCNQNSLGLALNNWIEGRSGRPEPLVENIDPIPSVADRHYDR
jgi:hypothetical protein